jgi:hypothetical protein
MKVAIDDRGHGLRERLRDRLEQAKQLRCPTHNAPVVAVSIHSRENGWFDTQWTTCCEVLQQKAAAILKDRC